MKRILAICLACVLLLLTAGCGTQRENSAPESSGIENKSTENHVPEKEENAILLDAISLPQGERYIGTFPTDVSGDAEVSVSREGIIELISAEWADEQLYYLDFQGISLGEVTLAIKVAGYCYELPVTVESEPAVYVTDGELGLDISVDKTDATVYADDTTVTYSVVTAPTVDRLVFEQLASPSPLYSYNSVISGEVSVFTLAELTVDDSTLTDTPKETEDKITYTAQKELRDDRLDWTVKLDFGYTAVGILRVSAYDSTAGLVHTGYLHLNIAYPVFDPSAGLESIALYWLERNIDEPLLFTVDTDKLTQRQQYISDTYDKAAIFESEAFMMNGIYGNRDYIDEIYYLQSERTNQEYYDLMFDSSPLYHMNTVDMLSQYGLVSVVMSNDPQNAEMYPQFNNKNRLVSNYWMENATYVFYGSISDEIRAVMAYLCGFEIDEETFPYAHSILQRGSEVIAQIIREDMTDFEKEKAIYDWMIENYQSGLKSSDTLATEKERYCAVKTAYGLLNGYHGDCAGWSGTFFTLCNMAGLDCSTVDVCANPGGAVALTDDYEVDHRINLVRLDGEYYFTEVFWFYQKQSAEEGDYRYMNMTTEEAAKHYTWLDEEAFGPVVCNYTTFLVDANTGNLLNG